MKIRLQRISGQKNYSVGPLLRVRLDFFESASEKTEPATQKKKEKAREEGQVAKSQEIGTAFLFLAIFFALRAFAPFMLNKLSEVFYTSIEVAENSIGFFDLNNLRNYSLMLTLNGGLVVLPLFAVAMVVGIVTNLIQVGWHPTTKPLKPKFSRLSPIKGFKRLFSIQILLNLLKSLLKFGAILLVIYNVLNDNKDILVSLLHMSLMESVSVIGGIVIDMALNVGMLYVFIAALDYAYARYKHSKDLRMTKQEVKEEWKQAEGNPQIKGKIRQKMREVSMRRMMQQVPSADVVITNPTHFAVALKFDRGSGKDPYVIAKGQDFLALKIKDVAKANGIVVVENKPLAQTMYKTLNIGQEIPPELFQAVAEILAYVYKLKNIA